MKYYIIAGEVSGDLHGAALMKELYAVDSSCTIRFYGGDMMASCGGTMARHCGKTAVMGFSEVVGKAGAILDNLSFCKRDILSFSPDAVILIDYPGFNLRIARFARKNGFRVYYFIPPKVWARGRRRVSLLRRYTDRVFSILPFEKDFFLRYGVPVQYVGNPLVDKVSEHKFTSVGEDSCTIALLPGSRSAELKFLMPRFAALEKLARADSRFDGYQLVIAATASIDKREYLSYLPSDTTIEIISNRTYDILKQSDAAVVCSGTASLEAALIGTPQVVCYGFGTVTYLLARLLVHGIRYISLANLILDRRIFKELIQSEASPDAMFTELCALLFDRKVRERMLSEYRELRGRMGECGAAGRVAAAIVDDCKK